jgi:hypothetical protein
MDASEFLHSKYVTAAELGDTRRHALIHNVRKEVVGRERPDERPVLELVANTGQAWPRDLVLNNTNLRALIDAFGTETNNWLGKAIEVTTAPTRNPQGMPVRGIVVSAIKPPSAGTGAIPLGAPVSTPGNAGNGTTAASGTGQTVSMAGTEVPVPSAPGGPTWNAPGADPDLSDEIPF